MKSNDKIINMTIDRDGVYSTEDIKSTEVAIPFKPSLRLNGQWLMVYNKKGTAEQACAHPYGMVNSWV